MLPGWFGARMEAEAREGAAKPAVAPWHKRGEFWTALILLVILAKPAYHIGVTYNLWQPLTRPANVPARARFYATPNDEAWFDCTIDRARDVNPCTAWDSDGRVIARGKFRLIDKHRAADASELHPSMVKRYPGGHHPELAWIELYGKDGLFSNRLVPVDDAGRPLESFGITLR